MVFFSPEIITQYTFRTPLEIKTIETIITIFCIDTVLQHARFVAKYAFIHGDAVVYKCCIDSKLRIFRKQIIKAPIVSFSRYV